MVAKPEKTKIIVSQNKVPIHDRGGEGVLTEGTNCLVRDILLQRKGKTPVSITNLDNISRTIPHKIVDEEGNVIFEITKKDLEENNKKAQIYLGLCQAFQGCHTDFYKSLDCCYLFELVLGIDNSYKDGGNINRDKYTIKIIPPSLIKTGVEFEIGDVIMTTKESKFDKNKVNTKTLEVEDEELSYKGFHFAVYIGNGYFISKYGKNHKFCIGTLEELLEDYRATRVFCLEQKEATVSKYTKILGESLAATKKPS